MLSPHARCRTLDAEANGGRERAESLAVTVHNRNLGELVELSVADALAFLETVPVPQSGA